MYLLSKFVERCRPRWLHCWTIPIGTGQQVASRVIIVRAVRSGGIFGEQAKFF